MELLISFFFGFAKPILMRLHTVERQNIWQNSSVINLGMSVFLLKLVHFGNSGNLFPQKSSLKDENQVTQ